MTWKEMEWNGSGIFIYSKLLSRIFPAEKNVTKKNLSRVNQHPGGHRTSKKIKQGCYKLDHEALS
jgi:hypothetical protein